MTDDEAQIRALIERWAEAVHGRYGGRTCRPFHRHRGVRRPPPNDGVRGIDAYRAIWPPFFEWQQRGASFEIVALDITAGDSVAFAYALFRCGTAEELEQDPDNRLRLSLGLRKQSGGWVVPHEHRSFPARD